MLEVYITVMVQIATQPPVVSPTPHIKLPMVFDLVHSFYAPNACCIPDICPTGASRTESLTTTHPGTNDLGLGVTQTGTTRTGYISEGKP
jgi:hypothetical protein